MVGRRQVAGHIAGKADCRIVEVVGGEIDPGRELAGFERLLPFLRAQQFVCRVDPDLAPCVDDEVAGAMIGHRDVLAVRQRDFEIRDAGLGKQAFGFGA